MNNDTSYLRLHTSCVPVKGAFRSLICDLQRKTFEFIPNDMFELLSHSNSMSIQNLFAHYGSANARHVREYLDFLLQKEFCFTCSEEELECFPKAEFSYDTPNEVLNCIVDVDYRSFHDWPDIIRQLNELSCVDIQIRFFSNYPLKEVDLIIQQFTGSSIHNIQLLLVHDHSVAIEELAAFLDKYNRIVQIQVHSSPYQDCQTSVNGKNLSFIKEHLLDETHCGIIHPSYFNVNRKAFIETGHHNSCLYRKISVDTRGEIKNCPSMTKSYGNIHNTSLKAAIKQPGFTELWDIKKDDTQICRDCEFRHICTDCRAYLADARDLKSKPLKCGYDPYTGQWEEWSTNVLKTKLSRPEYGSHLTTSLRRP